VLIVTEGVFSMDGDRAPLAALADIGTQYDAWLLCDDAHGLGVLGQGRGAVAEADAGAGVALQMGTLSKALGSYGGFLCADAMVCDYLRNRAGTFIYTTGLPPGSLAAANKALEIIERNSDLVTRPLTLAREFTAALNLDEAQSAIVPLTVGQSAAALKASRDLAARGFHVPAIRPPTVPQGKARLRFAFSAAHSSADVGALAAAVADLALTEMPKR
jgi:8-amino-7-oxononanoate synthase